MRFVAGDAVRQVAARDERASLCPKPATFKRVPTRTALWHRLDAPWSSNSVHGSLREGMPESTSLSSLFRLRGGLRRTRAKERRARIVRPVGCFGFRTRVSPAASKRRSQPAWPSLRKVRSPREREARCACVRTSLRTPAPKSTHAALRRTAQVFVFSSRPCERERV